MAWLIMLKPLPDFNDPAVMAKLGRLYALQNAWRDALAELRDCVTMLNGNDSARSEAVKRLDDASDRIKAIAKELQ